jgi:SAM-dependent methyltransferase
MMLIDRNYCALTRKDDLEFLHSFKKFPVFMGCSTLAEDCDLREDMNWWVSRETGLIQLNPLLPLDVLYPESHGAGCVGALWALHHEALAKFLSKTQPSSVFEIGGAHGILAREYSTFGDVPWTIIEPNPTPIEGNKARFIKGFFGANFIFPDEFDTVVHSHVLEHIYEPDQFMKQLADFMKDGKRLVFSIPHMQVMLERKYTNCINFEHTLFLTEPYIDFLLARHGFKLLNREYFMDDHSIFYSAIRDSSVTPIGLPAELYENNKKLYIDYLNYHKNLIEELNEKITRSAHKIYLFGAHVFAQYLIAFGLNTDRIISLLDNDPNKQGKRLCGTHLNVQSPAILKNIENPVVILKAGVYNEEIKADIFKNINSNVTFLE